MKTERKLRLTMHLGLIGVLVLFGLGWGASVSVGQPKRPLPSVTTACVPLYPRLAQMAYIAGVVRPRISTDGSRVSLVEVESGQPMLAQAAKENVKTWQFEQYSPTIFEVTFRYKLLPSECDSECNCGSVEKPSVLLQLPTDVIVSAEVTLTCDPEVIKH
jgi:hypothetical protein